MRGLKLSVKLPLLFFLTTALAAIAAVCLAVSVGSDILKTQALAANTNSVRAYASAIGFYLDNARSELETTADLPAITDFASARSVDPALHGLRAGVDVPKRTVAALILEHSKIFEYVMLLRADGSVYLLEPYDLQVKLSRPDLAFTAWYKAMMSTGKTVVSDLHISTATQRPTVVIATPVLDAKGHIIGVWAGALKLDQLSKVDRGGPESGTPQRYGYVTDGRGLVIGHQTKSKYVQDQTDFSLVPPVRAALAGQQGEHQFIDPIDRADKLGAYMPLPGTKWAVVYEVPAQLAFAPIVDLARAIALVGVGAAILIILASLAISRQITVPLLRLTAAAETIGAGDLTRRIEIKTGDEIERLADEFNKMAVALSEKEARLRDYAQELERRVQERTADLLAANTALSGEIAERKQAEEAIRQLNEDLVRRAAELETANKELEAFTYSVSHDLRSPLRAIDGFSRVLLEKYGSQLPAEAQRYQRLVRDNTLQMGRLIDDLLMFSRLSRQPLQVQSVAQVDLVRQVLRDLSQDQEGRHVEIAIGELPSCQADPALLKQVWMNLITNALKYTRKHDIARIEIGYQEIGEERTYFVRDNGVGFDMHYADKLFGVFQRLHRAEDYEGTGVGLAIVQRIIRRHDGRVWAEAEVEKGATFYFTLP
jgi:signal transduction histidine kinase